VVPFILAMIETTVTTVALKGNPPATIGALNGFLVLGYCLYSYWTSDDLVNLIRPIRIKQSTACYHFVLRSSLFPCYMFAVTLTLVSNYVNIVTQE